MSTVTLRPNGDSAVGANWSIGGGSGSHNAAQSDNSDATYSAHADTAAGDLLTLDFGTTTLPALSQVRALTLRSRLSSPTTGGTLTTNINTPVHGVQYLADYAPNSATIATATVGTLLLPLGATAWTQADVDAVQVQFAARVGTPTHWDLRLYEAYLDVQINEAPVATATTPSTASSRPTLTMTYTDPESDAKERHRIKIFDSATYGAGGFDPETATAVWDSGETFSSSLTATPTTDLANGTTYKWYVKVADAGSSGRYSAWAASAAWTVTLDPPGVPVIAAVPDNTLARLLLGLQGRTNLLTANQSSVETNTTGFTVDANCAIARSTAQFAHGAASLSLTSSASGDMSAITAATTVTGGSVYVARASFRSAVSARQVQIQIRWFNAAVALLSTSSGGNPLDTTTGFTEVMVAATAPATAVSAVIVLKVFGTGAASEVHFVDKISLAPGSLNLASEAASNFEDGTVGGWVAGSNMASIVNRYMGPVGGQAGLRALQLNYGGTNATATSATGLAGIAVKPSTAYMVTAYVRTPTGGTAGISVGVTWYTSAGALISTTFATGTVNAIDSAWSRGGTGGAVTSPANAQWAAITIQIFSITGASQVVYVDAAQLEEGSSATAWGMGYPAWSIGGLSAATHTYIMERFVEGATPVTASLLIPATVSTAPGALGTGVSDYNRVTDGDITSGNYYQAGGPNSITIDLGAVHQIASVISWHYYTDGRTYHNTKVEVSEDGITWQVVWDSNLVSEYAETSAGHTVSFSTRPVRYIRDTANGSTSDTNNHWVEIQAYSPGQWQTVRSSVQGASNGTGPYSVAATQSAFAYDYEAPNNGPVFYRARSSAVSGGNTLVSGNASIVAATLTIPDWWLKDPIEPAHNMVLDIYGDSFQQTKHEDQAVFHAIGRSKVIVVADVVRGEHFTLTPEFLTQTTYDAFEIIRNSQRVLLLQRGYTNEQWYIRLGNERSTSLLNFSPPYRRISIEAEEVDAP